MICKSNNSSSEFEFWARCRLIPLWFPSKGLHFALRNQQSRESRHSESETLQFHSSLILATQLYFQLWSIHPHNCLPLLILLTLPSPYLALLFPELRPLAGAVIPLLSALPFLMTSLRSSSYPPHPAPLLPLSLQTPGSVFWMKSASLLSISSALLSNLSLILFQLCNLLLVQWVPYQSRRDSQNLLFS